MISQPHSYWYRYYEHIVLARSTTGQDRWNSIESPANWPSSAEIHEAAEDQIEDSRGISFVDDVTWIVEGTDIDGVSRKLERCAAASLRWADDNAVRFEASKTEASLFSRRQKHRRCEREVRVGTHQARFNPGAMRWLGIWLDSTLNLAENRRRRIGQTRQAVARLRRIANQYDLQPAIVQGTTLNASELSWNGGKEVEGVLAGRQPDGSCIVRRL